MRRFLLLLIFLLLLPQVAFAQYSCNSFPCIVTGPNQWLPTSAVSYPVLYGSYTDEYQVTVRRMTNDTVKAAPGSYPSRMTTIENLDGTMFFAYASGKTNATAYSIFTTADGIYRGNLAAFSNNLNYISYDNFMWSNTVANEGYLFAQSQYRTGVYDTYPAKFWKIHINTSTWQITGTLLYTFARGDMPTCPAGEDILTVRNHDEAPASWDARYFSAMFKCTNDTSENLAYAVLLLDRDLKGFENPGIKGYVVLPPRQASTLGVSPGGNYFYWSEYGVANCGADLTCTKVLPNSVINGATDYNLFVQLTNPVVSTGGHHAVGYDDLGNEIFIVGNLGSGAHVYDLGYFVFNASPGPFITTAAWQEWKSTQYGPGHGDAHFIIAGVVPGAREWVALVDTSSPVGDECGYEGTEGTSTITFVHNSATQANQRIFRVAHERNEATAYTSQCFGGASRDASKFYFSSNWCNTETIQTFRVELPGSWWNQVLGTSGLPPDRPPGLRIIPK